VKVINTRRKVLAGLAAAAVLGTTGCSAINPQATTFEYATSDGTWTTVAADDSAPETSDRVKFLNIGVVTDSADGSGQLFGAIHNSSDSSQEVGLQVNDETFSFSVDAYDTLDLADEDATVESVGTAPGELADGVASAFGNDSDFFVSVLPPTLKEYQDLFPGDVDEDSQVEHLYDQQGQYKREDIEQQ